MTESELAYLALGLFLGVATGAALTVTLGTRMVRREIRVTVSRDAVPRRSGTLSQGAFAAGPGEPAPGGPGDRRTADRDAGPNDSAPREPVPVMAEPTAPAAAPGWPGAPPVTPPDRTPVPSATPVPAPVAGRLATLVAVPIEPETDTTLADVRHARVHGSMLERILRGEHLAMVEAVDAIVGPSGTGRREWEVLLGGLVDAMAGAAVRESVVDLPLGTAFWDTFTVEQCRRIVGSLASMGFRYDGREGWVDARVPTYRHLTQALADIGADPRRVRAWPNQAEIATLFVGARPAAEELLAAAGPRYGAEEMRVLVGERADELGDLWLAWDGVRQLLLAEPVGEPIDAALADDVEAGRPR